MHLPAYLNDDAVKGVILGDCTRLWLFIHLTEGEKMENELGLSNERAEREVLAYYESVAKGSGYERLLEKYDPVTAYARMVVETKYGDLCGKWEILACERHIRDIERAKTNGFPYCFDVTRAERIVKHFSFIPRVDISGETILLEPWQVFDYGSIFGWVRKDDGRRRFLSAFIENARGHAKTTIAAGIGLYIMTADALYPPGKPEFATFTMQPEIDIVAVDRFQGRKAREDMATMAQSAAAIAKRVDVKRSYIRHKTRGGEVVVYSKDTRNKDGGRPDLVICEEWHAHTTRELHDAAIQGRGKKPQCLDLMITTAGEDAENKPCYQDVKQYKLMLEGKIQQDDVFAMIREIDDGDDVHDARCWAKANAFFREGSAYGRHLFGVVASEYRDAYAANNFSKIRAFNIKRMDKWQTNAENKYMSGLMDRFRELEIPRDTFRAITRGVPGHYGYDLGETRDLTGVAWCGLLPDGRIAVSVTGFMPQNRASEHTRTDKVPYEEWAKEGYVLLTPGDVTDNQYVEDYIYTCETEDERVFYANGRRAVEIDQDGHNASEMANRMREHYNKEDIVVDIPQTCAMLNNATKRFREMVISGKIIAEYSPLFEWCLSNAVEVKNANGDIKLSKKYKDDTQRIDPVAALMNGLTRLLLKVENRIDVNTIIEERGFIL